MTVTATASGDVGRADNPLALAPDFSVRPSLVGAGAILLAWGSGSEREYATTHSAKLASWLLTLHDAGSEAALIADASQVLGITPDAAAAIVRHFRAAGLLRPVDDRPTPLSPAWHRWQDLGWHDAAEFHQATRFTRWRHKYPPNPTVMTWFHGDKRVEPEGPRPAVADDVSDRAVSLPPASTALAQTSAREAFARRRTSRQFRGTAVSAQQLGDVLHWTFQPLIAGETRRYYTTQSSSDGFRERVTPQPISAFVLLDAQHGPAELIAHGTCLRYSPRHHALDPFTPGDPPITKVNELMWGQDFADEAPALIIFVVNWDQYMWKYRSSFAYRMAHLDLGAFMQTALLAATACGLRTFLTPAVDDAKAADYLRMEASVRDPLYVLALGS
jgi:SagB-type dehydrogenase family enzyme